MIDLHDVPRGNANWKLDNPAKAALDFLKNRNDFILEQPNWLFNESELSKNISYNHSGCLKTRVTIQHRVETSIFGHL